jgi:hypothetical protein
MYSDVEHDLSFEAMGSHVRLLIGEPGDGLAPAATAAERAKEFVVAFDAALSRFRPESELCALNADERERVPARSCSELLSRRALARPSTAAASSTRPWSARSSPPATPPREPG